MIAIVVAAATNRYVLVSTSDEFDLELSAEAL